MQKRRVMRIFAIVTGILSLGALLTDVLLAYFGFYSGMNPLFIVLTFLPTLVSFVAFVSFTSLYVSEKRENNSRIAQISYDFGPGKTTNEYYTLPLFQLLVNSHRRRMRHRNQSQMLIAFTGVRDSLLFYNSHTPLSISFNREVMDYLQNRFFKNPKLTNKEKRSRDITYCFNRGNFLLFGFGYTQKEAVDLCQSISDDLFKLVAKKELHVQLMPVFGIRFLDKDTSIIQGVEDAAYAREISDKGFELTTVYKPSLRVNVREDEVEEIKRAFQNHEFVVYYQPKFNLKENRFTSSEALMRWNHPTKGLLGPTYFVPKVSEAGLTHELDVYGFNEVLKDLSEQKKRGRRVLPVSLNFALYEFYSQNFLSLIEDSLAKYNLDPKLIQIEITETTSQANPFVSVSLIKKLKEKGIRVLMDDFGIGYSNIGNLSRVPFDTIKLDKSYIDPIVSDSKAREVVRLLISLGKINNLEVIAEGADNSDQVEILKDFGCDVIQGYYFAKPMPYDDYVSFLRKNRFEKGGEEK